MDGLDEIEKLIDNKDFGKKKTVKKKLPEFKVKPEGRCIDCKKPFKPDAPKNKLRCDKCQKIHRKEQKRKPKLTMVKNGNKPTYFEPDDDIKNNVDVMREQKELPNTTTLSPDCEMDVPSVYKNPIDYLEINMVRNSRVVDTFYVKNNLSKITYDNKKYKLHEEGIYLLPTRQGFFIPTSFYKEGREMPVSFRQTNKGITGKALSLLYSEQLYMSLLHSENKKLNFFIVLLSLGVLGALAVGFYLLFFHDWGTASQGGEIIMPTIMLPFRWL